MPELRARSSSPGSASWIWGALGVSTWLSRPLQSLRPFAFALAWLGLLEIVLRLTLPPDDRVLVAPLPVYGCAADDELQRLVTARESPAASGTLDVVLIGDSVLGSVENRPGERLSDALSPALLRALGGRPVRVWNLSMGGARAADVYGALRRMQLRLEAQPRRLDELVVVLSSNLIFFSRRHSQPPMLFPCLLDDVQDVSALRQRLKLPAAEPQAERWFSRLLSRHLYLFQQRRHLAEFFFGGAPRPMLRERLKRGFSRGGAATEQPIDYARYAPNYDFIPLDSPDAVNLEVSVELARWLAASPSLRAMVVLTPHNHARLGAITDTAAYRDTALAVAALFRRSGVHFVSYDRDPRFGADMFLDLDHLTAAGNQELAERLAGDLASIALH